MVTVRDQFPQFVLNGDVERFIELADPAPDVRRKLRQADPDSQVRLLARAWSNEYHGSRNEAKKLFAMLMREERIPFTGDDIRAIVEDEPVETQT